FLTDVSAITAGYRTSMAKKTDGTMVWAWGFNENGQLGDGSTSHCQTPVQVQGLSGTAGALGEGGYHSMALKADGSVWTWGQNLFGQLGWGSISSAVTVPGEVQNLAGVVGIEAGYHHSLALKGNGSVWGWGDNVYGYLRLGISTGSREPAQASGLSNVTALSTLMFHVVAIKADGTVWAAGMNDYYQLGDGTVRDQHKYVQVRGANGVGFLNLLGEDFAELNPTIQASGKTTVGSVLTAKVGGQLPAGWSATYQWLRNGSAIGGAKAATYKIVAADAGRNLSVKVTVNAALAMPPSVTKTSSAVSVPALKPPPPPPVVKGMAQIVLSPSLSGAGPGDVLAVDLKGTLWRFPGSASGKLGKGVNLGAGWSGSRVYAPGDWDGDGKADLVAVTSAGKMLLYPGDGKGKLTKPREIGHGWSKYTVIPAGDLNGDKIPDMLAINNLTGVLLLYSGDGRGGFKPGNKQVGHGWKAMQLFPAGDLNKDGKIDVLGLKTDGRLFFYAGRGNGNFLPAKQVGHGWKGLQLVAGADVNGDKIADIVSRSPAGALNLYTGKGGGTFNKPIQIATGF
ncbi:MAG: FG-GAP-like repeat-containing protein, partial [Micrococcales bacterium]|nr:FG-GAP-like repeat-containing protein [Micrococcales bacterium]